MARGDGRDTLVRRGDIKDSVRNALWARAAGRCTICNRRLLGDTRTYLHSVLLAELAHNIGATSSSGSPRSARSNYHPDTEAEENLLLLCHDCHRIIDHPEHIEFFPPDKLREIKMSFERRIEMATSDGGLTRTAALRVGANIHGSFALASPHEVAETLFRANYLGLVETRRSGDFTCRISGNAGGKGFWPSGEQSIDDTVEQVRQAVDSGDVAHISVFAIAPIPLLVYLGWLLDDKTPTRIYQKQRDHTVGWSWSDDARVVDFAIAVPDTDRDPSDVVLLCEVTSEITVDRLPDHLSAAPVVTLKPAQVPPSPVLITNEQTLAKLAARWRELLAQTESRFPAARRWHLVASAPVSVAIELGRAIMREAHPAVDIYERTAAAYVRAISINDT
ncbi:SAVED domain-containing protein [Gordonia sp. ABKF26]|uniref:SAVED domain-containing protein n=1 Tax=Gordonia sp. ABKF26 TaxID=3238687 RepID=UPI0034E42F73